MSAHPHPDRPAREVIAPPHVSLRREVGRKAGPPPMEYGEARLWIVANGPQAVFAYWELRPEEHPEAINAEGGRRFFLRIFCEATGTLERTVEIDPACGKCTAPVSQSDAQYVAELGFFNQQGVWCFLARSGSTRTAPAGSSAPIAGPATDPEKPTACLDAPTSRWTAAQEARLNDLLADDVAEQTRRRGCQPPQG